MPNQPPAPPGMPAEFSPEDLAKYGIRYGYGSPQQEVATAAYNRANVARDKPFDAGILQGPIVTPKEEAARAEESIRAGQVAPTVAEERGVRPIVSFQRGPDEAQSSPVPAAQGPAIAMPRVIGAHHDPTHDRLTAPTRAAIEEGLVRHEGAQGQLTGGESAQQQALYQFHDAQARNAQARADVMQQHEQERQIKYEQGLKQYQSVIDDATSGKVDPERYMANQGTATRILMAIGAGLGGFVSAQKGGPNQFADMIQKNIDRDISAQQQQLDLKKWKAGQQMNMLGELRAQGMDQRQAANTIEAAQWAIAEQQLKSQMAMSQDPIVKARGAEALAVINDKRTELKAQRDMMTYVPPQVVGGGAARKVNPENVVRTPDGKTIEVRNSKVAEKLDEAASTVSALNDYNAEAMKIRKDATWRIDPEARERLKQLQQLAAPLVSKMGDNSVLMGGERKEAYEGVVDYFGLGEGTDRNLAKMSDSFNKRLAHAYKANAAPEVETGYGYNAAGQLVPMASYAGSNLTDRSSKMPGKKIGPE